MVPSRCGSAAARRGGIERRAGRGGTIVELTIPDGCMSTTHARLVRIGGRWVLEDPGSKNGTTVNGARERRTFLGDGDWIEIGGTTLRYREEPIHGDATDFDPDCDTAADALLATVRLDLALALEQLDRIARGDVAVVLRGETGTGKEVLARAVHARSGRTGRFVAVNCGALPPGLVESALFGHRKGAFSGAIDDRAGLVRSAEHGTLLLDEIGDLPEGAQPALLRLLQQREVLPVGDCRPVPVDVRFLCATHRDVASLVEKGLFRADLRARLEGFVFELPPLRDRMEDLGLLVASLLRLLTPGRALALAPEAARALCAYDWPRNVRELEQCLASAATLAPDRRIELEHLPADVRSAPARAARAPAALSEDEQRARDNLVACVRRHAGNLTAVARELGKDRKQIRRWMERYGIEIDRYRP